MESDSFIFWRCWNWAVTAAGHELQCRCLSSGQVSESCPVGCQPWHNGRSSPAPFPSVFPCSVSDMTHTSVNNRSVVVNRHQRCTDVLWWVYVCCTFMREGTDVTEERWHTCSHLRDRSMWEILHCSEMRRSLSVRLPAASASAWLADSRDSSVLHLLS